MLAKSAELRMNIILTVDDHVAETARAAASLMGKSLNQVVRDYLEQLAGAEQLPLQLAAFEASALASPGRLTGWGFNRDQANDRA
jgi:antitoxin component of RelBE/YafQ-DinJ toxin-antitoxin module